MFLLPLSKEGSTNGKLVVWLGGLGFKKGALKERGSQESKPPIYH